jgi:hypothetical protein
LLRVGVEGLGRSFTLRTRISREFGYAT